MTQGERIAKVIARSGLCSRRDAERLIASGDVRVNGNIITSPALNVTSADVIAVRDVPLRTHESTRLWLYHKPAGCITSHRDPQGRPTVFERLPKDLPRVISVGRLDFNTEGLLLLTNDGALARHLEHPAHAWERTYRVRVYGTVSTSDIQRLEEGIVIDTWRYRPMRVALGRRQNAHQWITLTLQEGKNREVRNALTAVGCEVSRLIRIAYGPFMLGTLNPDDVREVPPADIRRLIDLGG